MPGMTGMELLAVIKAQGLCIPVVLISGYSIDDISKEFYQPDDILTKPFMMSDIERMLYKHIPHHMKQEDQHYKSLSGPIKKGNKMSVKIVATDFHNDTLVTVATAHKACIELSRMDIDPALSINANACHKIAWADWDKLINDVETERKLLNNDEEEK